MQWFQNSSMRICALPKSHAASFTGLQLPLQPFLVHQFSTSTAWQARKKGQVKRDSRVKMIRYYLFHPLTPRPLRFSRTRYLRHWTIHRAWQTHCRNLRESRERELERQFNSMRDACEALRLIGEDGLAIGEEGKAVPPPGARDAGMLQRGRDGGDGVGPIAMDIRAAAEQQKEVGRLYRMAMHKGGVWDGIPIEYGRAQTETPPRAGWDHDWTR